MIDERYYQIIEREGYRTKTQAYEVIRFKYNYQYKGKDGLTVCYNDGDGLWYIVQSRIIARPVPLTDLT